jgi:hypothetical protein
MSRPKKPTIIPMTPDYPLSKEKTLKEKTF